MRGSGCRVEHCGPGAGCEASLWDFRYVLLLSFFLWMKKRFIMTKMAMMTSVVMVMTMFYNLTPHSAVQRGAL